MTPSGPSGAFPLAEALARIPGPPGAHAVSVLQRGTLQLKLSCPVRPNVQAPHDQDELYVVVRGHGTLVHGSPA